MTKLSSDIFTSAIFICSTTYLLKCLQSVDLNLRELEIKVDSYEGEVSFISNTIEDVIMQVSESSGSGVFTYSWESVSRLIKCLMSLEEMPITVVLDHYISIKEIIF